MWIFLENILIIGLFLLSITLFLQNLKLQQKVDFYKPMVETVENIRDILYYCETVPKLHYLYLSPTVNQLLGPNAWEEHLHNPDLVFEIVHPDDLEILMKKRLGQLNFNQPIKVRLRNHLGQYMWFEEHATPVYKAGEFVAVQGIFRNIDDIVALQRQLEYKSNHDALTDLYNRAFLELKLKEFNQCEVPMTVVVADLDELKHVNDAYGHHMGDQLVRETAYCLTAFADDEMVVSRMGGDEFVILLPNTSVLQVEQYINNVQEKMRHSYEHFPFSRIEISFGYAYSDSSYGMMNDLFTKADANMYKNKKLKRIF
jgi:diguanylate cyclase (GGDEF)-like protein/PAS domain S-box-containing protein